MVRFGSERLRNRVELDIYSVTGTLYYPNNYNVENKQSKRRHMKKAEKTRCDSCANMVTRCLTYSQFYWHRTKMDRFVRWHSQRKSRPSKWSKVILSIISVTCLSDRTIQKEVCECLAQDFLEIYDNFLQLRFVAGLPKSVVLDELVC